MLFTMMVYNGSLLAWQPRAESIGHSPKRTPSPCKPFFLPLPVPEVTCMHLRKKRKKQFAFFGDRSIWPVNQCINQLTNQSANQSIGQPITQSTNQSSNSSRLLWPVLLADHALTSQQVEAERGAKAVQVEYIQDPNLVSPFHDATMIEPCGIVHLFVCCPCLHLLNRWRLKEAHKLSKWSTFKTPIWCPQCMMLAWQNPVAWFICLFADHALMFPHCSNRWRQREGHKLSK